MTQGWEEVPLREFSFAVYDVGSDEVQTIDPDSDTTVTYNPPDHSGPPRLYSGDPEKGVQVLYQERGYEVRDIDHRNNSSLRTTLQLKEAVEDLFYRSSPDPWSGVKSRIASLVREHTSAASERAAIDKIDIYGLPDLLVRHDAFQHGFSFVEVKKPHEKLNPRQQEWVREFQFLPIKIAKIFPERATRDRYVDTTTVEDIIADVREESSPERPDLPSEVIANRLNEVELGDQLIFNDRKKHCIVRETGATSLGVGGQLTGVRVESPKGNQIVLSAEGDRYRATGPARTLKWIKILDS